MFRHPILLLPLIDVLRREIALPLQQVLHLYNVGSFLAAWQNPDLHPLVEQMFDSPEQARQAAATCAAWLGLTARPAAPPIQAWWAEADNAPPASQRT